MFSLIPRRGTAAGGEPADGGPAARNEEVVVSSLSRSRSPFSIAVFSNMAA